MKKHCKGWLFLAALLLASAGLLGCGGGNTAAGKGKVVFNGAPVTGGSLTFTPSDGASRPAMASINPDGTFTVVTDGTAGLAIGKHKVSFTPPTLPQPEWDGYGTKPAPALSGFEGLVSSVEEIDVTAAGTEVTVELKKPGT